MRRIVAIITDEPGWHGAQLTAELARRGWEGRYLSLRDCGFDLHASPYGVEMPGFETQLPVGAFVRGVPGGGLEEVVMYLDVLHALRELGVRVYNDARGIERSVDKAMTSFVLYRAVIPTPPSWVYRQRVQAQALLDREWAAGHAIVLKPLFGSQGEGLRRLGPGDALPDAEACRGVYYLQRYMDTGEGRWQDWRVFVIGARAVAAMCRRGRGWISNVAHGAHCHRATLDGTLRRLAEDATRAVGLDYAGVDILRDLAGRYWVVEVNGIPAWKGLQGTCERSIARALVEDFLGALEKTARLQAVR
jgi:RimK family alpha-L-glutamate ligase